MVLHQNRACNRGTKNFIPDSVLPTFLDLVIWGHEHDSYIEPLENTENVYISQPGSSVATSLSEGESIPKRVGVLRVYRKKFDMAPIELKTVRPFIFEELPLVSMPPADGINSAADYQKRAMQQVATHVDDMIERANNLGRQADLIPLIRLKVLYRDERLVFNGIRFGQKYVKKVANPEDMIKFVHLKSVTARTSNRTRSRRGNLVDGAGSDDDEVFYLLRLGDT